MKMTVQKLNTRGEVVVSYEAELAGWLPGGALLHAQWTRPPLPLGYTTFEAGDRFREEFYTDRWYSIFEIRTAQGVLKGWYCNIAEPATISGAIIACRDLLLDLWVAADGTMTILDEDELEADTTLDLPTRERARATLDELQRMVREREPPFDQLAHSSR
jgi:uncharacterized protein